MTLMGVASACPDYIQAIEDAEQALRSENMTVLEEALVQAERGLACGPILENRRLRASFWLSQAVRLDARSDRTTSDKALLAAWRADADVSIGALPTHLRVRYGKVTRRPKQDASFRLVPAPDPNAVIYVDGQAFQQRASDQALAHDASILTTSGLHIIQLAETPVALKASASRVPDLPPDEVVQFDIYEEDLLGGPLTPLRIGRDFDRPTRGCASQR